MAKPIVFLSDLGVRDEFVGVCHSVVGRISPHSRLIDLSHGVPPQDVSAGALLLARALPYLESEAVILAIVDPGAGTERKAIAVQAADGRLFVGPDNGLLSMAWTGSGGPDRSVEITSPDVLLQPVSPVFQGRDVFTPAAAHLANGAPLDDLGPAVDVTGLVTLHAPEPEISPRLIRCEVLSVDRFGNVQLNVRPEHLTAGGLDGVERFEIGTASATVKARRVMTYGEVQAGEYGAVIDAWGWIDVIRYVANASDGLGVGAGDQVWITPA